MELRLAVRLDRDQGQPRSAEPLRAAMAPADSISITQRTDERGMNWASQALPRVLLKRGGSRAMLIHQLTNSLTHQLSRTGTESGTAPFGADRYSRGSAAHCSPSRR